MEKIKVKIVRKPRECFFKVGDEGFIIGHNRGANDIPFAVVVVGKNIDLVDYYALEYIE